MNETQVLVSPKWQDASNFKLYVCPVNSFTKESLMEYFCQFADVVDIYMSNANQSGFKWAFVYFTNENDLLNAASSIKKDNTHNFKVSRAKSKIFPPNDAKYTSKMKIMDGDTSPDCKSLVVPNCANCKKLTFHQCGSCKNPFCSKECTLDGWRSHTGPCVKIADLIRADQSDGHDYSITPTVVNFMKDISQTKKNFTTKEFADACNSGKSMASASPSVHKQLECNWGGEFANNVPRLDKHLHPGKAFSTSFYETLSISDNDETDEAASGVLKKFQKRDNESNSQPFKNNNSEKSYNRGSKMEYHQNASSNTNRKPSRKTFTDIEDTEENERNRRKSSSKSSQPKYRDSDTKEPNRNHNTTRKNSYKGSGRTNDNELKMTSITPQMPLSDLKLQKGAAVEVIVTSITNHNTFFIANPDKVVNMLQQIIDCASNTPKLSKADLNTLCLANFDGDYYRARIVNTVPITVEYIDYGNREEHSIDSLKKLPDVLEKTLPLATKVQLKEGDVAAKKIKENEVIYVFVEKYQASENYYIVDVL